MNNLMNIFGENTNVGHVLRILYSYTNRESNSLFHEKYKKIVDANARFSSSVFLSVLTRTQGKRPDELREVLLCLSAQTDMDFEILLVVHKANPEQLEEVQIIVAEQVEQIRQRIRILTLDHGNRTAPLNFGFAHARGQYVAVLDDDDVVFDDWVEKYHQAASKNQGTVIHAYALLQEWEKVRGGINKSALRASGSPKTIYCKPYNWLGQTKRNNCPLMSLAFPAAVFQKCGIIFDESLTTTEDWDYMLRVSILCGVTDVESVTCIYRWWINSESSQTVHSKDEWKDNYCKIQEKVANSFLILPPVASSQLLKIIKPEVIEEISDNERIVRFKDVKGTLKTYIWYKYCMKSDRELHSCIHFKDVKNIVKAYYKRKLSEFLK